MGTNTLTARSTGQVITPAFFNDFRTALMSDHVPRNSSGVPEDLAGSLGQPALRWDVGYFRALNINGTTIDLGTFTSELWRNVSGKMASTHNGARVLEPHGTNATVTIKAGGANPDYIAVINGQTVVVESDIAITGLTLAPSSNNTALINSAGLADPENSKYIGEVRCKSANTTTNVLFDRAIPIDNIGTEISTRAATRQAFSLNNGTTTEVFMGVINTASLDSCLRGFAYDSSYAEQARIVCTDNDVITLLMVNYVFLDENGSTTYTSVLPPVFTAATPGSPATNQYWFDLNSFVWKRYNGSTWDTVDRHLVGWAICDSSGCKWAHTIPYYFAPSDHIDLTVERTSNTVVRAKFAESSLAVGGNLFQYNGQPYLQWDIASDLVSGFAEAASTLYYLYVTDDGLPKIEPTQPRKRDWRGGHYHPHKPWRCVGHFYNDASSHISAAACFNQRELLEADTPNGRGSTNTAVFRMTTVRTYCPSLLFVDSATLGSYVVVLHPAVYSVQVGVGTLDCIIGIDNVDKNTGEAQPLMDNHPEILSFGANTESDLGSGGANNSKMSVATWVGFLEKGTIIYPMLISAIDIAEGGGRVRIEKVVGTDDSGYMMVA